MANLKLVGAVAIKVRPDADGFRGETDRQIKKELAGYDVKVPVDAKVKVTADTTEAKAEAKAAGEEIEKNNLKLKVGLDFESIEKARRQLNEALSHIDDVKINVDLNDDESIRQAEEMLARMRDESKIELKIVPDEQGMRDALNRLIAIKRQKLVDETVPVTVEWDDASIDAKIAELKAKLAAFQPTAKIHLEYEENREGLEKLLRFIDSELARINKVHFDIEANNLSLAFAKASVEEALGDLTVKLHYDDNEAGLRAIKTKLENMLGIGKIEIETKVDEASLRAELAKIDAQLKAIEDNKTVDVHVRPDVGDFLKTAAAIRLLTRDQRMKVFITLDNTKLLLAAAKLTGLRAAAVWSREFAQALGTLDRNLPIVAGATLLISQLSASVLNLTADMFSLGNGVGEVVRMAGLMAPALITGLGFSLIVLQGVFKDFGAAVHGIEAAMKRLPPAGQEAARTVRTVFAEIRQAVSENFWDRASDSMLRFSKTALPAVGDGLGRLGSSLGGIFSGILDSFTRLTQQGGIDVFFANLTHGLDLAQTGLADFMDAFNTLSVVGSRGFPRMGQAFNDFAAKLDDWVQRLAADGTLSRWIDEGVQGMKDLVDSAISVVKIWGNIGQAAQAAGAQTLHSFAGALDRLDQITAGSRFQRNMKNIFQGAGQASEIFARSLGALGPAFDQFSVTLKNTMVGAANAFASLISNIGAVLSSPLVNNGITAFLTGLKSLFDSLRPAAGAVATILETVGQILGQVATDSGPLFRNLFQQLSQVLTTAWAALEPFLPGLIQLGTTVINILGPALQQAAQVAIPAFADGLTKIGGGLLPLVGFLSDVAVNVTKFVTSMQPEVLLGMAAAILSLGTGFKIAAIATPLAVAALKEFGFALGITATRMQLLIPGVGLLLAALTGLAFGGIGILATSQQNAIPFANQYEDAILADAQAVGELNDAIGENLAKTTIKNLADQKGFEAARGLGISAKDLTDAVLGQGDAYDRVKAKIDEANRLYDEQFAASQKVIAGQQQFAANTNDVINPAVARHNELADQLNKVLGENRRSYDSGKQGAQDYADGLKAAGISLGTVVTGQRSLGDELLKNAKGLGTAANASAVLRDEFASSASKVDAMRKSLELLSPPNAAQKTAENLGAYAKGLQDIRDASIPLKTAMQDLGKAAYGQTGFLNIASGNKAILQVNQALIDQVDNTWAAAKVIFDQTAQQTGDVKKAFEAAKKFVDDHHGDFNQLAIDSGLSAKQVQGQWEAVFGKDWVLKITLSGQTEVATKAQAMMTALQAKFDGQKLTAFIDANPDAALRAFSDATGVALEFVTSEWKAKIDAAPEPAQEAIRQLVGQTKLEWNQGNFESILKVAKDIPGLAEALLQILRGAHADYQAIIFAAANRVSVEEARRQLDALAVRRTAIIDAVVRRSVLDVAPRPIGGQRLPTSANGSIMDRFGRGRHGFNPKYFANGGIENHVAQITRPGGPVRIWAEPETSGEAYIPYSTSKRPRSVAILSQVARDFGYTLGKAQKFANGGTTAASAPSGPHTSVTVGTINTVDPEAAIRRLRTMQRDSMAVAGII